MGRHLVSADLVESERLAEAYALTIGQPVLCRWLSHRLTHWLGLGWDLLIEVDNDKKNTSSEAHVMPGYSYLPMGDPIAAADLAWVFSA